jgi:hypothetical protein
MISSASSAVNNSFRGPGIDEGGRRCCAHFRSPFCSSCPFRAATYSSIWMPDCEHINLQPVQLPSRPALSLEYPRDDSVVTMQPIDL